MTKKRSKRSEFKQSLRNKEFNRRYIQAFDAVYAIYLEVKWQAHTVSYTKFYEKLGTEHGEQGCIVGKVFFSTLDFICDVELCVKKLLSQSEYEAFKGEYLNFGDDLKRQLGREFKVRGIYPWFLYWKPTTVGRGTQ